MASTGTALPKPAHTTSTFQRLLNALSMPALAIITAFILGGIVIWVTSGSLQTVVEAYSGIIRGAFIKERGLSESLLAAIPYIFLSLAVAVGFKAGLFNIGVEGQFVIGALTSAFVGHLFARNAPSILVLPLTLLSACVGGAIWAAIPGYLKAKTGAHEVITTIMMNYVATLLAQFLISGPLKDKVSSAVQTPPVAQGAWIWSFSSIPEKLKDPLNALGVAIFMAVIAFFILRLFIGRAKLVERFPARSQRRLLGVGLAVIIGLLTFFLLPPLSRAWWPFTDQYDRLHIGLIIAVCAAVFVWWLLWKTTLGFELRTVGANANAARYAGINITRNIVLAMVFSGALAGLAGSVVILGVTACHCMPVLFDSGYGFESIAVSLLARNDPFGILASAFLWGSMRNGADLMELNSGVSKYIISLIQALALLFVAAPAIVRSIYRIRAKRRADDDTPLEPRLGG